jgi:hypothetical protein
MLGVDDVRRQRAFVRSGEWTVDRLSGIRYIVRSLLPL